MWRALKARLHQKYRTAAYPAAAPVLPERFRGMPELSHDLACPWPKACAACPIGALTLHADGKPRLDMGACLFCEQCSQATETKNCVTLTRDHRLCARKRADLVLQPNVPFSRAEPLAADLRRLFGRSLKLRQVSAGGCNACEADTNVLTTPVFDLSRFGIQFVASPRHADGLFVTGPVTRNMSMALQKTYDAVPAPKIVIACGACAVSGGPFAGQEEVLGGADKVVPVDLYIPGCPPHPFTILDGLLRLLGRIE